MDDLNNNFGKSLRLLRKRVGITQEQLASDLGVAKANISRYEKGTQKPEFSRLIAMAALLKVPSSVLLGDQTGIASLLGTGNFADQPLENSTKPQALTAFKLIEQLAVRIQAVHRDSRGEVASHLSALTLAPDSTELRERLVSLLSPRPPVETKDFAGTPEVKRLATT